MHSRWFPRRPPTLLGARLQHDYSSTALLAKLHFCGVGDNEEEGREKNRQNRWHAASSNLEEISHVLTSSCEGIAISTYAFRECDYE
jgi:hypothetical protein